MLADILRTRGGPPGGTPDFASFKDFDVLVEMEKRLQGQQVVPIPEPDQLYRASGLARMCPREEVLRHLHRVEKVEQIDARLRRIFDFGNAFNDLVQNRWFGEWGWLVGDWVCSRCDGIQGNQRRPPRCPCGGTKFQYKETEFINREHGIIGHLDGVIEVQGVRKLIELKTCNSRIFRYITTVRGDALEDHREQINTYMWLSGVPFGAVIYLEKDESQWRQFPQHLDLQRRDRVLQKVRDARHGMRTKTLPKRICEKQTCAKAKACSVRKLCFQ